MKTAHSKTIFTVIPDKDMVITVVNEIKAIVSDSKKHAIGFMFTSPVRHIPDEVKIFVLYLIV